jgi:hypothetical protein
MTPLGSGLPHYSGSVGRHSLQNSKKYTGSSNIALCLILFEELERKFSSSKSILIINSFLSLRKLVRYQKLTPYICAKYVVFGGKNEMYADCTEDAWISTEEIPYYQPHITMEEMYEAHKIASEEDVTEGAYEKIK